MATVKVYSTPACPYCNMAKEFLKEKGVEFEDVDVSQNQEAAKEMVEKSGQMGVPVLEINGQIIVGFDKAKIEQALGSGSAEDTVKKVTGSDFIHALPKLCEPGLFLQGYAGGQATAKEQDTQTSNPCL